MFSSPHPWRVSWYTAGRVSWCGHKCPILLHSTSSNFDSQLRPAALVAFMKNNNQLFHAPIHDPEPIHDPVPIPDHAPFRQGPLYRNTWWCMSYNRKFTNFKRQVVRAHISDVDSCWKVWIFEVVMEVYQLTLLCVSTNPPSRVSWYVCWRTHQRFNKWPSASSLHQKCTQKVVMYYLVHLSSPTPT